MNNFELFFLADSRNHNLLLLAAEIGEAEIVESLLNLGMDTELPQQNINAQTLAWNGRHSNVLSVLIQANLTYPESFEISHCSRELQKFYKMCIKLHDAVIANNEDKVEEILDDNPTIQYFYNSKNESVSKIAIANKCNESYKLLLDRKIFLAPHENFEDITEDFEYDDKRTLREIHFEHKKDLPEKHLNILRLNSFVSHDVPNVQDKLDLVMKAYKFLNQNAFTRIILLIVAASKNFKIIYDFNRDSVNVADPTVSSDTQGLFYLSGRIYIGAKQLLSKATEKEAYATLAHEFCHYAMHLVYGNGAIPYKINDHQSMQEFEDISRKCQQNSGKEEVVDTVYELYPPDMFHAELIVRVPHMLTLYHDQPEKIQETRQHFQELYDHYEKKVVPEMTDAIPEIETRDERKVKEKDKKILNLKKKYYLTIALSFLIVVISMSALAYVIVQHKYADKMFKFENLRAKEKDIVRNSSVNFKNNTVLLKDLFPIDHKFYSDLTKDHVDKLLSGKILNISDPTFSKVNTTIFSKWDDLSGVLRGIFLNSTFSLQEMDIKFEKFYNSNNNIFKNLSYQQINDVFDKKPLKVGEEIKNNTKFYVDRMYMLEDGLGLESSLNDSQMSEVQSEKHKRSVQSNFVTTKMKEMKDERSILQITSSGTPQMKITAPQTHVMSFESNSSWLLHGASTSSEKSLSYWENTLAATEESQDNNLEAMDDEISSEGHLKISSMSDLNPEAKIQPLRDQNFKKQQEVTPKNRIEPIQRKVRSPQEQHQSTQKNNIINTQELVNLTTNNKVFILSSEPGEGKTVTLQHLALEIKRTFPDRWVCFVDLKEHTKTYNESGNFTNFWKLMNETVNLKYEDEFGRNVFLESFKMDEIVFIWDGFDEVTKFKSFILNVLRFIHVNTENVQFIGTSPLYKDDLIESLKGGALEGWMGTINDMLGLKDKSTDMKDVLTDDLTESGSNATILIENSNKNSQNVSEDPEHYKDNLKINSIPISFHLVPCNEAEQDEFLRKALTSKGVKPENLEEFIKKVKKLMTKLKSKAKFDASNREFNTPFLLGIFTKGRSLNSGNLYEIYESFLGNNKITYQKQALKAELLPTNSTIFLKLHKFEIFKTIDQNSIDFGNGILLNKSNNIYEFSHKSFSEFYVAQYLIENVYDSYTFEDSEAELRLELLFYVVRSYGYFHNGILDFMKDFLKIKRKSQISDKNLKYSSISDTLKGKFKKFLINLLNTEYPEIFDFLINFFGQNCDILRNLIKVDDNETFYTSMFNPIYVGIHINPWDIKFNHNCFNNFSGLKDGKDQKGIKLLGNFIKNHFVDKNNLKNDDNLNLEAFNEISFWNIANITLKFLNNNEKIQLCKVLLNPKIYLNFGFVNLTYYDVMWKVCGDVGIDDEVLIGQNLASLLEADSNRFLATQIEFIDFYVNKIKSLEVEGQVSSVADPIEVPRKQEDTKLTQVNASNLSQSKRTSIRPPMDPQKTIHKIFKKNFILHKAARSYSLFSPLWEFYYANTNNQHQIEILEMRDNGEFFHFYDQKTSNINQYYDGTEMRIFHRALLATGTDKNLQLDLIQEIYSDASEYLKIYEFITKESDFISYILQYSDEDFCEKIADYFIEIIPDVNQLDGLLAHIKKRVSVEMNKKAMNNWKIFRNRAEMSNDKPKFFTIRLG